MLAKFPWTAWLPRVLPALLVLLAYYVVSARSIYKNLQEADVKLAQRQQANQTLQVRQSELAADLERLQKAIVATEQSYEVAAKTSRVATERATSSQTFSSLLEIFERHRLSCQRTENIDQGLSGKVNEVNYAFELTGAFVDVSAALQDIVNELSHVAPAKLHLRRESNGVCRWEITFQMEQQLL